MLIIVNHDILCKMTLLPCVSAEFRDANINIQKIGFKQKNREVFKISCNFNDTKLARNREVVKFWCQNGQKMFTKKKEPPSETERVGISTVLLCP